MNTTKLILEHGLPPRHVASNLMRQLPWACPVLSSWLVNYQAEITDFDPFAQGCSSLEYEVLTDSEFVASPQTITGAGIAPLYLQGEGDIWVAELGSVGIGQRNITYVCGSDLQISHEEALALYQDTEVLMANHGFSVSLDDPLRWRIHADTLPTHSTTPDIVLSEGVEYCWPKHANAKPWRRLLNEIQMHWHYHPVNVDRQNRGLPSINTLWLHGGAPNWKVAPKHFVGSDHLVKQLYSNAVLHSSQASLSAKPQLVHSEYIVNRQLSVSARNNQWSQWMNNLTELDTQVFAPLQQAIEKKHINRLNLVLLSNRQRVSITIDYIPKLLRWVPRKKQDWSLWWLGHN